MAVLSPSENGTVRAICHEWGLDPNPILAIIEAEGGSARHLITAVQCSIPEIKTFDKAVDVACRSYVHAMSDVIKREELLRNTVVGLLASRWAPPNAENDPTNLNPNWGPNVLSLWRRRDPVSAKDVLV